MTVGNAGNHLSAYQAPEKIDSFMSSLGINVGHTGGSMLGELMIAFREVQAANGGAFGYSRGDSGGGRIIGKESIGGAAPTEFEMYNSDQ